MAMIMHDSLVSTGVDKARDAVIASIMKLPVVGGLTQAEGVALGAYVHSGAGGVTAVPDMKQGIHGVFLDDGAPIFLLYRHNTICRTCWT